MKNIQEFVSSYNYNLNQQNFIERRPNRGAKYLNTISIQSISASLRQHGIGVVNTAVNSVYKFLSQKFQSFSQLLIDDFIRSLLSKEMRWSEECKVTDGSAYSFDRAVVFSNDMRKLGSMGKGRSILDQLRVLVTEIGNSLGFVRMVRSAGMHFCSEALQFLPQTESASKYLSKVHEQMKTKAGHPDLAFTSNTENGDDFGSVICNESSLDGAAKKLDRVIFSVSESFTSNSDYIRVFLAVFQDVMAGSDHSHLDGFFAMVPALSLSWMEASLHAKETMQKKNRTRDAYYTDDGFALGIAFILAVLKQNELFDALCWFRTLRKKFAVDEIDLMEKRTAKKAQSLPDQKVAFSFFPRKSEEDDRRVG